MPGSAGPAAAGEEFQAVVEPVPQGGEAERPGLTVGVVVPDLDAAVAAAEAAGGTVVMPPTDNGWVVKAQVEDPAGNRLSLIAA